MRLKVYDVIKNMEITENISDLMPLIFKWNPKETAIPIEDFDGILAAPWPIFSIEMDGNKTLTFSEENHPAIRGINIVCILAVELEPDKYKFYLRSDVTYWGQLPKPIYTSVTEEDNVGVYLAIKATVHAFLEKLYDRAHGTVQGKSLGHQKYKTPKGKKDYKPRQVIYVNSSKQKPAGKRTSQGNTVTWREGYSVRAHWRRMPNPESLGLNRLKQRVVKGLTWIPHHRRKDGEIKPRIVT